MAAIQWTDVEQRLEWEASKEEYDRIRTVWLKHCDTELKQDMEGLLSTLTDDCVYTALLTIAAGSTSQRWEGQAGAGRSTLHCSRRSPTKTGSPRRS